MMMLESKETPTSINQLICASVFKEDKDPARSLGPEGGPPVGVGGAIWRPRLLDTVLTMDVTTQWAAS